MVVSPAVRKTQLFKLRYSELEEILTQITDNILDYHKKGSNEFVFYFTEVDIDNYVLLECYCWRFKSSYVDIGIIHLIKN